MVRCIAQEWWCLKMELSPETQSGTAATEDKPQALLVQRPTVSTEWIPWTQYDTIEEAWDQAVAIVQRTAQPPVILILPDGAIYKIERMS